jgi:uncharacterized protein DUF4168
MSFNIAESPKSDRNSRPITLFTRELRQRRSLMFALVAQNQARDWRQMMEQLIQVVMRTLSVVVLTAALTVLASPAGAQTQPPAANPSQQAPNLSDQKLDAIAAALERVVDVRENYERKLKEAPPSDIERIADEAKGELVKAVTDQGLSVEEYNSILVVAQNDPEVRKKIIQRMKPPAAK